MRQSQIIRQNTTQQPLSEPELKQKYLTLQSILALAQINSSYYHLLTLFQKKLSPWENTYFRLKTTAFLKLADFKPSNHQQLTLSVKQQQKYSPIYNKNIDIRKLVTIKSRAIFKKLIDILSNKKSNLLCLGFIKILKTANQWTNQQVKSQKSSKPQTNDSLKSKILKRSPQKLNIRKSYSMQKQHDFYIPVKYQPQPVLIPISNNKSKIDLNHSQSFNIIPHKINSSYQITPYKKDHNTLTQIHLRKTHTISMKLNKRYEKINQIESLKRKYDKLMSEFNWFSLRFLKVIEEEEDTK